MKKRADSERPAGREASRPRGSSRSSPVRSRLLILLPFTLTLLAAGSGYLVMQRYSSAVREGVFEDPLAVSGFQRFTGILVLLLAFFAFCVGLAIALGFKKSLESLSEDVGKVARGSFGVPLKHAAEEEVDELRGQFSNMVQALNRVIHETGMGATVVVDMEGDVRMINPLAQLLLEVRPARVIGQPFSRVFRTESAGWNDELVGVLSRSLREREPVQERRELITLPRGRQSQVTVRTSFFSVDDEPQMAIFLLFENITQEMSDATEKIEQAARFFTLGSLAARLAHEIRNPLASICGLVEILKDSEPDPETRQQYIEHIETSAERLNDLIEALMDVASLEKCTLEPSRPEEVLQEALATSRYAAAGEGGRIELNRQEDLPRINCSRKWLGQALRNIIDNAMEAAPAGGKITVSLIERRLRGELPWQEAERSCVEMSVHNTGSYIPEDRRDEIFEPFETGKPEGTGLGLSIVQQIVQAHGGVVYVQSDREEGTRFVMRIPAAPSVPTVEKQT